MRYLLSIVLLFTIFTTKAQVSKLNRIFDTYQEAKGVTSIKIGKPMFAMLNNLKINDSDLEQIKPLLSKINGIKMLIIEDGDHSAIQDEVKSAFANINYQELIAIHSDGSRIKFLAEEQHGNNNILKNLLLDISSDGSTIFMILDGIISYDDINNLVAKK